MPPEQFSRPRPIIEVELTNRCNAACVMCPADDMKRTRGFMTRTTMEELAKQAREYGAEVIRFCGLGEPLLHPDVSLFLRRARELTPCELVLYTNASIMDDGLIETIQQIRLDRIVISNQSVNKQNFERINKGLKFEQVFAAIAKLLDAAGETTQIAVSNIITKYNEPDIPDIEAFWHERGVKEVSFFPPNNRGGHLKDVRGISGSIGRSEEPVDDLCIWPRDCLYIAWDGSALLCCSDLDGDHLLGNIHDAPLTTLAQRQSQLFADGLPRLCRSCDYNGPLIRLTRSRPKARLRRKRRRSMGAFDD